MKLETIKKSKKKSILIGGLIVLLLVSVVTYTTTRAKYKSVQSLKLANGSVNFKGADMSLVAINVSEDGTNYTSYDNPPEGLYTLNTTRSKCRIPTSTLTGENAPEDSSVSIEYTNNKINILGLTTKNTKCYVYLDKLNVQTSETIIAAIKNISKGEKKTGFGTIATGSEKTSKDDTNNGIFSAPDGMYNGTSYYFRGTGVTNHVVFAGKCWRIVRINGDESIRIIYNGIANGNSCANRTADQKRNVLMANWDANTGYPYTTSEGASNKSYYVGWTYGTGQRTLAGTDSYAKKLTEDWFKDNANFTADQRIQVASGYFCNDRNVSAAPSNWSGTWSTQWSVNGTMFAYAGAKRLNDTYSPTLACDSGDTYQLKVGAITADEVEFAGGKNGNNSSYYLYTGKNYWTMTPYRWDGSVQMFIVDASGSLILTTIHSYPRGLRPVINLDANSVMFEANGNGTESNPYVVI